MRPSPWRVSRSPSSSYPWCLSSWRPLTLLGASAAAGVSGPIARSCWPRTQRMLPLLCKVAQAMRTCTGTTCTRRRTFTFTRKSHQRGMKVPCTKVPPQMCRRMPSIRLCLCESCSMTRWRGCRLLARRQQGTLASCMSGRTFGRPSTSRRLRSRSRWQGAPALLAVRREPLLHSVGLSRLRHQAARRFAPCRGSSIGPTARGPAERWKGSEPAERWRGRALTMRTLRSPPT
mmetsp:Transcript_162475/g.520783  ORF Transcript_162475/g.520783 Transcript_162475/m.520783 type:complete len:232 (+) Transcript_162475:141-836(+)